MMNEAACYWQIGRTSMAPKDESRDCEGVGSHIEDPYLPKFAYLCAYCIIRYINVCDRCRCARVIPHLLLGLMGWHKRG